MRDFKQIVERVFQKNKEAIESSPATTEVPPHIYLFYADEKRFDILELQFGDAREKAIMTFYVRNVLQCNQNYSGYVFVSEAYAATLKDGDTRQPEEVPERVEILMVTARSREGQSILMKAVLNTAGDRREVGKPDIDHGLDGGNMADFFGPPSQYEMETFMHFVIEGGELDAMPMRTGSLH